MYEGFETPVGLPHSCFQIIWVSAKAKSKELFEKYNECLYEKRRN
jgi:hypothetical protein